MGWLALGLYVAAFLTVWLALYLNPLLRRYPLTGAVGALLWPLTMLVLLAFLVMDLRGGRYNGFDLPPRR